jgi:hypothetical protein
VKNIANIQVGHVPKAVAAKLSPLLDRRLVTVEGVMQEGNSKFACIIFSSQLYRWPLVSGNKYSLRL